MLNVYAFTNLIAAITYTVFGAFFYFFDKTKISIRAHAFFTFSLAAWAFDLTIFYSISNYSGLLFVGRLGYFIGTLIALLFLYFTLVYPENKPVSRKWIDIAALGEAVLAYLFIGTDLILKSVSVIDGTNVEKGWTFGPLIPVFYIVLVLPFAAGFIILIQKTIKTTEAVMKKQVTSVLWSALLSVLIAYVVSIILPAVGVFRYFWMGPIFIINLVILASYALIRKQIFTIPMIVTQIAIMSANILLFIDIFAAQLGQFGVIGRVIIFGAFAAIGLFFIRKLTQTEQQKEELARLTFELQNVNENLQTTIDERTRELQKSKARTEIVIENLTSGLLEFDNSFILIRINKAAERLLGIDRKEIVGKKITPQDFTKPGWASIVEVTYPIVSSEIKKLSPETSAVGTIVHDITIRYPEERELQVATAPLVDSSGQTIGFIKALRDVTREKIIARSKSEFISIAAHQLRTPLSVMKWVLGLFLTGEMGTITETQRDMISRSNTANEKMINLVNDLLDVSRIEEGRFGYEFREHDLMETLRGIIADYRDMAKDRSINFIVEEPLPPLPTMTYDESKIILAVHNLLDNAFHYTKAGGSVQLIVKKRGNQAEIIVRDTGIGIPPAGRERLFTKFFRADNAVKTYTEGSGLGLFIVNNIVVRHGGKIEVESEENKGTTFHILIPLNKEAIPEKEEEV
jgi:PAS domain S-box-containing protein